MRGDSQDGERERERAIRGKQWSRWPAKPFTAKTALGHWRQDLAEEKTIPIPKRSAVFEGTNECALERCVVLLPSKFVSVMGFLGNTFYK